MDKSPHKKKKRDKSDVGPNFIVPDGGWGWFVVVGAGCSNVIIYHIIEFFFLIEIFFVFQVVYICSSSNIWDNFH